MASIVAIGNLKGGVGKTTLAVNIACELATTARVHLIDADPQATAYEWYQAGSLPFFAETLPLADGRDAGEWVNHVRATVSDLLIIDLPPNTGPATAAAMMIADLFIMPVTPSLLDGRAAIKALRPLRQAREARRNGKPDCLLVPNRVDRRMFEGRQIEAALHEMDERVGPAVALRSAYVEAAGVNQWIGGYAPRSPAHIEIAVLAAVVERLARHNAGPD